MGAASLCAPGGPTSGCRAVPRPSGSARGLQWLLAESEVRRFATGGSPHSPGDGCPCAVVIDGWVSSPAADDDQDSPKNGRHGSNPLTDVGVRCCASQSCRLMTRCCRSTTSVPLSYGRTPSSR